MATNIKTSKNC